MQDMHHPHIYHLINHNYVIYIPALIFDCYGSIVWSPHAIAILILNSVNVVQTNARAIHSPISPFVVCHQTYKSPEVTICV